MIFNKSIDSSATHRLFTAKRHKHMHDFVLVKDDSILSKIRNGYYKSTQARLKTTHNGKRKRMQTARKSIDLAKDDMSVR